MQVDELVHARRQPGRAEADGGGDPQRAGRLLGGFGQPRSGCIELEQHLVGGAEELVALLGEDETAGMAVEEGNAEILLQRAHLPAHRRLAHVEVLTGMGERPGLCGRVEDAQLVPVQHRSPATRARPWTRRYPPPPIRSSHRRLGGHRQELLRLQRGHAALSGGGHGLAEGVVGDVAGGKDAGNAGDRRVRRRPHIVVRLELQLPAEEFHRRRMADGDEDAVGLDLARLPGLDVADAEAGDRRREAGGAEHVFDHRIPDHGDLIMAEKPVLQDRFGAQLVTAVNEGDLGGVVGQVERFLNGGVAAADHHHFLVAIEEAVAGGAGGDAEAAELLFRRQVHPLGFGAGRHDQSVAGVGLAAVAGQPEGPAGEVDRGNMVADHARADVLGLRLHLLHQPGALDHLGEARIVFHVGGGGELAAGGEARNLDRFQHGAGRVDGRGVAGRAGTHDDNLGMHDDTSGAAQGASLLQGAPESRRPARRPARAAAEIRLDYSREI